MTAKTNAERQAAHKARKRDQGKVPVEVWVRPENANKVKAYAAKLELFPNMENSCPN